MKTKNTSMGLLATLTFVALLVAACGGSDSSKSIAAGNKTDYAAVHGGTVLVSTDGGAHWRAHSAP